MVWGFFCVNNLNVTHLLSLISAPFANFDKIRKSARLVSYIGVTKFPRQKPVADQISTNTSGQIGTPQLFNILLDILLADQCMHTALDLTDRLPSCMPKVQQEEAGEQECTSRIKGMLDHRSWRKNCLLKYHQSCKETLKVSQYLIRHN